jgi:hypothetical protein
VHNNNPSIFGEYRVFIGHDKPGGGDVKVPLLTLLALPTPIPANPILPCTDNWIDPTNRINPTRIPRAVSTSQRQIESVFRNGGNHQEQERNSSGVHYHGVPLPSLSRIHVSTNTFSY